MPVMSKEECKISSLSARIHVLEERIADLRKENQELKEERDFLRGWSGKLSNVNSDCLQNNAKYISEYRKLKEENERLRKQLRGVMDRSITRAKILELVRWAIDEKIVLDTSSRACKEAGDPDGVVKKVK